MILESGCVHWWIIGAYSVGKLKTLPPLSFKGVKKGTLKGVKLSEWLYLNK